MVLPVAIALLAGLLLYAGLHDMTVTDVLRVGLGRQPTDGGSGSLAGTSNLTTTGSTAGSVAVGSGKRGDVVNVAHEAAAKPRGYYIYSPTRPYPRSLFSNPPVRTDCSGFVTLCYKEAGAKDPNGLLYSGFGFTGTLLMKGSKTQTPQPGDLCFWSTPDHVGLYIGNGQMIQFGSPPGPIISSVSDEHSFHQAFLGYRSYLP